MKKIIILLIIGLGVYYFWNNLESKNNENKGVLTPTPTPTKLPTVNRCVKLPVLMYHHIENNKLAKKNNWQNLNVDPDNFRKQLEYLKINNFETITFENLINYFDKNVPLPPKSIMVTFDDAYEDNYTNAYPILKEYKFKASIFVPTGLIQNPEYLNWQEIKEMSGSGLIYFGNHTWSHYGSTNSPLIIKKEIERAEKQLTENNQNSHKVFAYPYGSPSNEAMLLLKEMNYQLAFTTKTGNVLCSEKRLELPRIRAKNDPKLNLEL